jgi:hypothetical protein
MPPTASPRRLGLPLGAALATPLVALAAFAALRSPSPPPAPAEAAQAAPARGEAPGAAPASTEAPPAAPIDTTRAEASLAPPTPSAAALYDPLAEAEREAGRLGNPEAGVPPACYTKTEGRHNPCWVCHTAAQGRNTLADWDQQAQYAFSRPGRKNRWTNLFEDWRAASAKLTTDEVLAYVREDNYEPLRAAMLRRSDFLGYRPDLSLRAGFDELGFARDGSGWRALRYKPFPGTFWPTNGGADDAFVRLPEAFRRDANGAPSLEIYRANLSILEANLASNPATPSEQVDWPIEPLDENALGVDLDRDGARHPATSRLRGLPDHYLGAASNVRVRKGLYPAGVEFLHSVRYLDPEKPSLAAERMKELRYSKKEVDLSDWALGAAYDHEADEKDEGRPPLYQGSALVGLRNKFGWVLQGYIEDQQGRLRLQTDEEHRVCVGCHGGIGVTTDTTFTLPRKVPGLDGWRPQDLRGMTDAPQVGHRDPEVLTYLKRAGGGDEFRSNAEMLTRFFPGGRLDETALRRAAPGGDRDLFSLIAPSRERALALDKAYLALVRTRRFALGRDAPPSRPANVFATITDESTGLEARGLTHADGRLQLAW